MRDGDGRAPAGHLLQRALDFHLGVAGFHRHGDIGIYADYLFHFDTGLRKFGALPTVGAALAFGAALASLAASRFAPGRLAWAATGATGALAA